MITRSWESNFVGNHIFLSNSNRLNFDLLQVRLQFQLKIDENFTGVIKFVWLCGDHRCHGTFWVFLLKSGKIIEIIDFLRNLMTIRESYETRGRDFRARIAWADPPWWGEHNDTIFRAFGPRKVKIFSWKMKKHSFHIVASSPKLCETKRKTMRKVRFFFFPFRGSPASPDPFLTPPTAFPTLPSCLPSLPSLPASLPSFFSFPFLSFPLFFNLS